MPDEGELPDNGRKAPSLPPLRSVIARYGLGARRSLGQHFLLDLNLTRRIARAAGSLKGCSAIEVGPGPGGLTRALLESEAARVIAVERDARCLPALEELAAAYPGRLSVIEADALTVDLASFGTPPRMIVANLPYNVATPLALRWLARPDAFAGLVLMFQKEVALRLVARPDSADYGRLSIWGQWLWRAEKLFDIAPSAFVPPPRVVSRVVRFVPREAPLAEADPRALERVLAAAFGQRRKMLRASLRQLPVDPEALLAAAGIEPTARAETLDIPAFCALARALAALESRAALKD